jgi:LuxR family maltose regulon positive regulatory protein
LRKWEVLLLARVALAQQQYTRAVETLERFSWHLDQPADIEKTLEWMALYAVALHHSGKRAHAARVAARLLTMTEPEGYVRVYLDAGEPMREALEALLEEASKGAPDALQEDGNSASAVSLSGSSVALVLAAFEQEERKRAHRAGTPLARTQEIRPQPPPAEEQRGCAPLSPQEQRVLRLLVAGGTYAEMAKALIVSPNTIKTQVSSIYRKLGVSRRAQAIAATQQAWRRQAP